jgi:multidrug efflux pump
MSSLSDPFVRRPVATVLITIAITLAGAIAYFQMPVSPLPQVDFPTISVSAGLPGASPEVMAASVATPLERQFGRIAGVTEMTSSSSLGSTNVVLQFDLDRDINAAARDVQAAINAARSNLPTNLPSNPSYRKVNPADSPIMIIALTSDLYDRGHLYDFASTLMQQRLSQINGVGQVIVGGSSLPAVRVELNPTQLNAYGIGLESVRTMLGAQNANLAKGQVSGRKTTADVEANDQLLGAVNYRPLVVAYRNGSVVRLADVATVNDSVEDIRNMGMTDGKPSILVIVFRQPGANIIDTVERVRKSLPPLMATLPAGIRSNIVLDQTVTIKASVKDVERTLCISTLLVVLVVFFFLGDLRTTFIPSIAVPVSLVGTFGVMYLMGFSIDNLSMMALTIATGFVVDDAIVVIENITRYLEKGMSPLQAALTGAGEIGFTVLSISISLVAVFIPILMMGGFIGRMFREFAVTLTTAILVSLFISLTATPMLCAYLLKKKTKSSAQGGSFLHTMTSAFGNFFGWMQTGYARALQWVLKRSGFMLAIFLAIFVFNIWLFVEIPKGLFPQQDTGRIMGSIVGAQDSSFQAMQSRVARYVDIVRTDPAVQDVVAFIGGGGGGGAVTKGQMFVMLKPLGARKISADQVINRLRPKLAKVKGATTYLQSAQDLRVGGRSSAAQYQYTLQSETIDDLKKWGPILLKQMQKLKGFADVNSDQQNGGLETMLTYDRATAMKLGLNPQTIDNTLYDAFGQRQVSTMYTALNQYHVVMEVAPKFWQSPEGLKNIYVATPGGGMVPLSAIAHYEPQNAPLSVAHQGQWPAVTLSFNLQPGYSISQAADEIVKMERRAGMPETIHGKFAGTLQVYQTSLASEPMLILTALLAVYIVLGVLYESFIHPVTILSTLPSAGVGALLALIFFGMSLDIIALIGIILLIGIVKKNAILMIDFALVAERTEGKSPRDAIYEACLLRFRPIMMTTMAALLGALPLALGTGVGSELRKPLGVSIVGGLLLSQALTLFTTPVVYLYMDKLNNFLRRISPDAKAGIINTRKTDL